MPWSKVEAELEKGDPEMELRARAQEPLGPGFSREFVAKADMLRIVRTKAAERVVSHSYFLLKKTVSGAKIIADKKVTY